jgi:GNAT superfamily N-acetyltransferase
MTQVLYRTATLTDVDQVKALTDVMLEPTGLGQATKSKIHAMIANPKGIGILAFVDDRLVGYTYGILHENIFNNVLRATDIGVFVLPKYRNLDIAKNLIERLESWAKDKGANQFWLGQTTGDNVDVIAEYYRRLGFKIRGFNAVKEL